MDHTRLKIDPVDGIVQPPVRLTGKRRGCRTNVLRSLKFVLNALWNRRWAFHFYKPVDTKQVGMANYYNVIKEPMDLGTIKKRFNNNYYRKGYQAIRDFKLVFANCFTFHEKGTVVRNACKKLKTFFYYLLSTIDLNNEENLAMKPKGGVPPKKSPREETKLPQKTKTVPVIPKSK
ncbi:homeotic protein female sterile-like [Drosophila serrata]|uniref:homeotic protein female sterile-like n=1 Tax=Drosophila serrata TaxID=7274 RepID=UPI000A1D1767|nr:homeotic protein female sterile-like [Drosophila serrata]XP_020802958.1 homeotic protein female sterile-like [Drosophila serrata]